MLFIIGLIIGIACGVIFKPYVISAWEWIKSKFTKTS
jgi:predicted small secreted protein